MNNFKTLEDVYVKMNESIIKEQVYKDGIQLAEQYLARCFISQNAVKSHIRYHEVINRKTEIEKRDGLELIIDDIISEKITKAEEASGINLTRESIDNESINALIEQLIVNG